jgi:hypothetical protein
VIPSVEMFWAIESHHSNTVDVFDRYRTFVDV